jgi:hypothetical protein
MNAHSIRWERNAEFWSRNVKGRYHLGDINAEGKIILKWILKKQDESGYNTDLTLDRADYWEHGNETSGSKKELFCCWVVLRKIWLG